MAGVQAQEIQYKSPAEATTDVMTARIHYWFSPMATAVAAKDKVRVLGVTTPARVPQVPEAPAIAETLAGPDAGMAQHDGSGRPVRTSCRR